MKTKSKRRILAALGALAFMAMLGAVGGMDLGIMPVGKGAALAASCEALGAALWYKAGVVRIG